MRTLYILGDADRVREKVEGAIFRGDLEGLSRFSTCLTVAISSIVRDLEQKFGATAIMAGGDDILVTVPGSAYDRSTLVKLASDFKTTTGCTISFGVSFDLDRAYLSLRRAKSANGCVVHEDLEA